jgi:hypothetical protein
LPRLQLRKRNKYQRSSQSSVSPAKAKLYLSVWEVAVMNEQLGRFEFDIIPPLNSVTITLNVSPSDLELAVATSGVSLCPAMMRAIVAAMVIDTTQFCTSP